MYELCSNRICQFDVDKHENYIEINYVRTAGYHSGCGLFKNLIGEIYKRNGLIPIVLNTNNNTFNVELINKLRKEYIVDYYYNVDDDIKKQIIFANKKCHNYILIDNNIKDMTTG